MSNTTTSNSTTTTIPNPFQYCNSTALKALNLHTDFIYFGGLSDTHNSLAACCAPELVWGFEQCSWCRVPQNYQNNGTSNPDIAAGYEQCLHRSGDTAAAVEFVPGDGAGDFVAPVPTSGAMRSVGGGGMGSGVMGLLMLVGVLVPRF